MVNWNRIRNSKRLVIGGVFALYSVAAAAAPEIKSVDIDTRIMAFPVLQLDGIDYAHLRAHYAVKGVIQTETETQVSETIQCGSATEHTYTKVAYRDPTIVFRIVDMRRNQVVFSEVYQNKGETDFGRGICDSAANTDTSAVEQKKERLANIEKQFVADVVTKLNGYLAEDTALKYEDVNFPFYYIADEKNEFTEFNEMFDQARIAFDLNLETGITVEAGAMLDQVAKVFEGQLTQSNGSSEFDRQLKWAIHQNLAAVYFMLGKMDLAKRHDARAMSSGISSAHSLQELILKHERRRILSPVVAANPVLTANLFRFGNNAVKDLALEQLSEQQFAEPLSKESLDAED